MKRGGCCPINQHHPSYVGWVERPHILSDLYLLERNPTHRLVDMDLRRHTKPPPSVSLCSAAPLMEKPAFRPASIIGVLTTAMSKKRSTFERYGKSKSPAGASRAGACPSFQVQELCLKRKRIARPNQPSPRLRQAIPPAIG